MRGPSSSFHRLFVFRCRLRDVVDSRSLEPVCPVTLAPDLPVHRSIRVLSGLYDGRTQTKRRDPEVPFILRSPGER